ncbi:MAG: GNAT family N-acetyltransferase [Pseudomonadota bacterium]
MTEILSIGPAQPADAAAIGLLSRNLIEHGLPWTWVPARLRRCIRHNDYVVLAARRERQIAGFAVMQYHARHAHLCLLGVRPEFRRRGVGRRLVGWLEKSARVAGVFNVILEVRESNSVALSFYQRLGYQQAERLTSYYGPNAHALRLRGDLRRG